MVGAALQVPVENIAANCDNIVFLRQLEAAGRLERLVSIVKTRGGQHDRAPRPFDVTDRGLVVGGARAGGRAKPTRPGADKPRKRRR